MLYNSGLMPCMQPLSSDVEALLSNEELAFQGKAGPHLLSKLDFCTCIAVKRVVILTQSMSVWLPT